MARASQGGRTLEQAILDGDISLDNALTQYRPPTGGERLQTFAAVAGRAARDAYMSGTSAELRLVERGLAAVGAESASTWMRGFADYVAPGGGLTDDVGEATGMSLPEVPHAAQNEPSAVMKALTQYLPEGLGSSAGIVALPGGGGMSGLAVKGALVGGGQQWVEAKSYGADDTTAWKAFAGGAGLGATDAVSLGHILGRADQASGGLLRRMIWDGVIKGGAEEGAQETLQTIGENLLAAHLYDSDRKWAENVLESGEGGALTGMLLGMVGGAVGGRHGGQQGVRGGQELSETASAAPSEPIQPDAEAQAAMAASGATELRDAGPELQRFAPEGARVYTGRGMRRPGVTLGNTVIVDESNAAESLVDHEIGGHLARVTQSEADRTAFLAAVDQIDPGIRARSLEDYAQDELAARRKEVGRDLTAEEEASIRAAIPEEEGIARVFEDLSPVVRALRTDPEALSRVTDPGVWKKLLRAVADLARRAVGGKPTNRQKADLAKAWKTLGGVESVDPETGRELAKLLGGYLEGVSKGTVRSPEGATVDPKDAENGRVRPTSDEPAPALPEVSTGGENASPETARPGAYAAPRRPDVPAMRAAIQASTDEELTRIIASQESDPDSAARRILAVYERARRTGDSATMNEIRRQLGGQDRFATWRRAMPTSGGHAMPWDVRDRFLAYAVDSWRAPGRWRDALASAGKVTDANDVVLQENLRRSGTLKVVQDETASHVVPLRELLAGGPVSLDEAGRYLLARAAPDRNALILSRGGQADGSGMTDADAAAITSKAEAGPHAQRYKDIADAFDRLTARKLDLMEQYGLLSSADAASLRAQEPRYAPMKRDPQAERLYGESERPTVGVARTRRKEFRAATGRSTEAENPIVYATMDLMAAIERGMWNATTGRAVLEMAREFSDPKIALVDVPATQRTVNANGQIVETPAQERENEIVVKENGVTRVVRFGKGWETVAAAIKGGDSGAGDMLLSVLRPATRVLAGLSTRWNPAFMPVNVVRDMLGAHLNASADLGPAAASAMVNPRTVGAMLKDAANGGPWSTRFANAGGPVAFLDLARTFEEEAKRTIRSIGGHDPSRLSAKVARAVGAEKTYRLAEESAPWKLTRRKLAQIGSLLETMGQVSENATRMAAFKYAVEELGATDARAAQYAKNLTTNFERRGSNAWMSSLYAFSNAGVQGTARVGQALRTPWGQRAAAGLVAGAFVLSYLNRITGGNDEDGVPRWDKIPEWQRRSNAILMVGDTKLMVPMPFVWNIFSALGTEIERGAFGGQGPLESTSAVGSALAGALNPLGGEADFIDTATPTLLDPAVQVARNRDYAGRMIHPPSRSERVPDSEIAWDTTSPTLQTLASGLNSLSGGDAGTPGLVDVSPATLEFLSKQYLGGVGGESSRVLRLAEKMIRGEDVEAADVPVVRRFVGSMGLQEQRGYYKRGRDQIESQVLRQKAGQPYDESLWRLRKRANRWDERVSELEKAGRTATGPERDRIRAELRSVFLEATEEIEGAK